MSLFRTLRTLSLTLVLAASSTSETNVWPIEVVTDDIEFGHNCWAQEPECPGGPGCRQSATTALDSPIQPCRTDVRECQGNCRQVATTAFECPNGNCLAPLNPSPSPMPPDPNLCPGVGCRQVAANEIECGLNCLTPQAECPGGPNCRSYEPECPNGVCRQVDTKAIECAGSVCWLPAPPQDSV
jgi:hypothetical protein